MVELVRARAEKALRAVEELPEILQSAFPDFQLRFDDHDFDLDRSFLLARARFRFLFVSAFSAFVVLLFKIRLTSKRARAFARVNAHRYFNGMQSEMLEFVVNTEISFVACECAQFFSTFARFVRARFPTARLSFSFFFSLCFPLLLLLLSLTKSFLFERRQTGAPTGSGKTVLMELALIASLGTRLSEDEKFLVENDMTETTRGKRKVVYLAPLRALVSEKLEDWGRRFGPGTRLNLKLALLTGDVDDERVRSSNFWREINDADILLATPEKLDSMSRRNTANGGQSFFADISVVLIDEVHCIGDSSRGATLEAIISRLRAIGQTLPTSQLAKCRYVAVSATAPNVNEIAEWLSTPSAVAYSTDAGNVSKNVWEFGEEFRPVSLEMHVQNCGISNNDFLFEKQLASQLLDVVLDKYDRCPCLIFCATRDGTWKAAKKLDEDIIKRFTNNVNGPFIIDQRSKTKLQAAASKAKNKQLKQLIQKGIGVHNASLESSDRDLVENLFRDRCILALCSTSTLALGVNLPARLVVVFGTKTYRGGGKYVDIERGTLIQMAGRAGRPRLDQRGVVVIMTDQNSVHQWENLANNVEPITSSLISRLPEHINAEVDSGVIFSVPSCVQWLTNTFMYTRRKNALATSGNNKGTLPTGSTEAQALRWAKGVSTKTLRELKEANLCEFFESNGENQEENIHEPIFKGQSVNVKAEGSIMSRRYIRFESFKQFQAVLDDGQKLNDNNLSTPTQNKSLPAQSEAELLRKILSATCHAIEFGEMNIRQNEKLTLKNFNNDIRIPLYHESKSGKRITKNTTIKEGWEKLYILTQNELSDADAKKNMVASLRKEVEGVLSTAPRLLYAAYELYLSRKNFSHAVCAYQLMKSIELKQWFDSKDVLTQLPKCGTKTVEVLIANNIKTFFDLESTNSRKLERLLNRPFPFGDQLKESVRALPSEVRILLEIQDSTTLSSKKSPSLGDEKKKTQTYPSVNIRVEFVAAKIPSCEMNLFSEDEDFEPIENQVVNLPQRHSGVLIVGCEHDNSIIFRTKLPTVCGRVVKSEEDLLILESQCTARSLPNNHRTPVKFFARVFFDHCIGRDAFGWVVGAGKTPKLGSAEKIQGELNASGRRLQTSASRTVKADLAKVPLPETMKTTTTTTATTTTKNHTIIPTGAKQEQRKVAKKTAVMTISQNRSDTGLAQMRKTKQTTLVSSFPAFESPAGKRLKENEVDKRNDTISPQTYDKAAIRELWGCNWDAADDDDNDDNDNNGTAKESTFGCKNLLAGKDERTFMQYDRAPATCDDDDDKSDSWDFAD